MYLYDWLDHGGQTVGLDTVFYSGLWHAGCRRRAFFHGDVDGDHVAFPGNIMCCFMSVFRFRSDGGLDWNVYGLDGPGNCVHIAVFQRKMGRISCDSID